MRRWGVWGWRLTAAMLATAAVVECVRALEDPRAGWWYVINSDTLNIPDYYQNVVLDGYTWRAYRPSAATFAFPDGLVYFTVKPFVARTATAVVVWVAVCFALLVASAVVAGRAVVSPDRRVYVAPAVVCLAAAYLGYLGGTYFQKQAVEMAVPVYHTGALTATFLGIALTPGLLRGETRRRRAWCAAGLFLLSALTLFSDRLFGLYFVAPAGLAAVVAGRGTFWSWRRGLLWGASACAGCLLGLLALRAATAEAGDALAGYWTGVQWDSLGERVTLMVLAVCRECGGGNVVVISALLWYPTAAVAVRWSAPDARPLAFYYLVTVVSLALVTATFLLSGASVEMFARNMDWREYSRYYLGPFGAAYFGWAALLADRIGATRRPWVKAGLAAVPTALAAGLVGTAVADPKTAVHDPFDYYPPYVREVDEVCGRYGARRGMGGYWQAREVTLLSRTGLRVSAVSTNDTSRFGISSHLWLSNAEEVWKPPAGWGDDYRFDFVLATSNRGVPRCLYTNDVIARLGQPASRTRTEPYEVLVYDRPDDAVFRNFADLDLDVQFVKYRLDPRAARRFYGVAYRPGRGSRAEGLAVAAGDRFDGPEPVASGPYLVPRRTGRYRVRFRVTAPVGGVADAVFVDPVARGSTVFAAVEMPPGTDGEVALEFDVTPPMRKGMLEFRVIRTAPGPLVFHWAEFEKLP